MLPVYIRNNFIIAAAGAPDVFEALLAHASDPAVLDRRPDPERFTIREVIAHLADWEGVFQRRVKSMLSEETPELEMGDQTQMAIDHDYAHSDPARELVRFRAARAELVEIFRGVSADAWERAGIHRNWGRLTVEGALEMIGAHDGYHAAQIAQWLKA
ncbi:MAG: DinB family protein [Capsulimonadaceae bacterium]|nr:DinB family protein [Capsulimonadaceae bacterium]